MINPKFINLNQLDLKPGDLKKLALFFSSPAQSSTQFWQADTPYSYADKSSIKFSFQIIMQENKERQICRYDLFSKEGIPILDSQTIVYPMLGSLILTQDKKLHYIPNLHDEVIMAVPTDTSNLEKPFKEVFRNLRNQHPFYSEITFGTSEPIIDSGYSYTVVRQIHGEKLSKIIKESKEDLRALSLDERVQITLALLEALKEINPRNYQLENFNWERVLVERHQPIKVEITHALPKKSKVTSESKKQEANFIKKTGNLIYSLWSDLGDSENVNLPIELSQLKDFDHLTLDTKKLIASTIENMFNENARFEHLNDTIAAFQVVKAKAAMTSEKVHNQNCYSYLKELRQIVPDFLGEDFKPLREQLEELTKHPIYKNDYPYAQLYTRLITFLDQNITSISTQLETIIERQEKYISDYQKEFPQNKEIITRDHRTLLNEAKENRRKLDTFINAIYNNNSYILEQTYAAIKHIPLSYRPSKSETGIEHTIAKALLDNDQRINVGLLSPADNETRRRRFMAAFGRTFTPQYSTNIPSRRSYGYHQKTESYPVQELRIGTQAQRYKGTERVSPLFEYWLEAQRRNHPNHPSQITHIYFNNLGRDREGLFAFEGKKEKALTKQLENLETRHPNIAVITLPADKGFMARESHLKTKAELNYQTVYDTFLNIARQKDTLAPEIKDFYISPKIRALLFNFGGQYSDEAERSKLQELLTNSFIKMGIVDSNGKPISAHGKLSRAERQAVWFHFIKFELTNYIIDTLKPLSINFSCKDAIDRGGASSAYFNLMKSIDAGHPLSRDEFEQALHAAATSVKGRGMNHHLNVIWNAIDNYVNTHYKNIQNNPGLEWLIQWRDFNCPHGRVAKLLQRRIKDVTEDLEEAREKRPELTIKIEQSLRIIKTIESLSEKKVSGKRLLLEAVSLTPAITLKSDNKSLIQYDKLADELRVTHPKLQALAGMMKAALGIILVVMSFGRHTKTLSQGVATLMAGYHADKREVLTETMKDHITLAKQLGMKDFDKKIRLFHTEEDEGESDTRIEEEDNPAAK
ncbi:hypothetical protein ACQUW5_08485 [Legionella sp. CNM-1927-20]|uniref:hypothetical protein n=1 Tax=Legionella sp. CNM-1927-20 TaxID=3422221 RepID=UPI00403A87D9